MLNALVIAINAGLYLAIFAGIVLIFGKHIRSYMMKIKMRRRLVTRKKQLRESSVFEKHLDNLLAISMKGRISSMTFLWFCALLFFLITLLGMYNLSFSAAITAGAISAVFPYMLLRFKLEGIRKKSSFEGESIISHFLSSYRISSFNIYEAMEKTALQKQKSTCGALLYGFLMSIRSTSNKKIIDDASEKFTFAVNSNWSRMLGYNIVLAARTGINVSPALEDILIQLREARVIAEERKRQNSESSRMVLFLIPIMYCATIYMSLNHVGITPARLIHNQFFTAEGFILLITSIFLFFANLIFIQIVNNQKFDY